MRIWKSMGLANLFILLVIAFLCCARAAPVVNNNEMTLGNEMDSITKALSWRPLSAIKSTDHPRIHAPHDVYNKVLATASPSPETTDSAVDLEHEIAKLIGTPDPSIFLLYDIERGIRTLSLADIEYVLGMGVDVLSYSLADKLGYLKGSEDDAHIKVIEDNKDKLVSKLKARREELKLVPLPPTIPPSPETTTPPAVDWKKIRYDIVKKIVTLSVDQIDNLLESYEMDTLPFALGMELGYDDDRDADHFQYLGKQGGEKWIDILVNEKEKKLNKPPPSPPKTNAGPNDGSSAPPKTNASPNDGSSEQEHSGPNKGEGSQEGVSDRGQDDKDQKVGVQVEGLTTVARINWPNSDFVGGNYHPAGSYWGSSSYTLFSYCSGYSLRDYIIFCIIIGIAFGIGYLCSCPKYKSGPRVLSVVKHSHQEKTKPSLYV